MKLRHSCKSISHHYTIAVRIAALRGGVKWAHAPTAPAEFAAGDGNLRTAHRFNVFAKLVYVPAAEDIENSGKLSQ
jgi:hypothetical protein